jgi:hypothetical protein
MRIADFGIWEFVVGLLILGSGWNLMQAVVYLCKPHVDDKDDDLRFFYALFVILGAIAIGGLTLAMLRRLL